MNVPTLDTSRVQPITFDPSCGCNTTDEVILQQVAQNIRRGLPQVFPHEPHPLTALLVCGGPSLEETEDELVAAYWGGAKIITANGAYQWCIDRNLKPSAAVMLDAREFNSRFIETPVDGCKYLIASQCHARTFELCRDRETLIWHACSAGEPEVDLLCDYYFQARNADRSFVSPQTWFPITLGTTIGIRAISLLRLLGFTFIDIFGLDSCWMARRHHAYAQAENDRDKCMPVWTRPRDRDDKAQRFLCAPWHIKQAEDFMTLIRERGNMFQLNVHGPGLIATILRTGAEIQQEESPT